MFILSVAQEMVVRSQVAPPPAPAPAAELPEVYPGTTVPVALVRRLIDDSFIYLSPRQRGEVFDALHAELIKPQHYAVRASMIEYFAQRALQVRAATLRLAQLSQREKELLAAEFRAELKAIPAEEHQSLRNVMEQGLLPVPADLNRLLLAAFH